MMMKAQLRAGLSSLPAPSNDFEIVIPEEDQVIILSDNVCYFLLIIVELFLFLGGTSGCG